MTRGVDDRKHLVVGTFAKRLGRATASNIAPSPKQELDRVFVSSFIRHLQSGRLEGLDRFVAHLTYQILLS